MSGRATMTKSGASSFAIANGLLLALVLVANYFAGSVGIDGQTIGSVSDSLRTRFTPAGFAFSIWGLIYLGMLINAVELFASARRGRTAVHGRIAPLLYVHVANVSWLWAWLSAHTGLSVVLIVSMALTLLWLVRRLEMETWDAPLRTMVTLWWPIDLYSGWVSVAALANLSAWVAERGWVAADSSSWALAMVAVAVALNVVLVLRRNLREHALVGVWALSAVAVANHGVDELVFYGAIGGAALLVVLVSVHAYRRRATLPLIRKTASPNDGLLPLG